MPLPRFAIAIDVRVRYLQFCDEWQLLLFCCAPARYHAWIFISDYGFLVTKAPVRKQAIRLSRERRVTDIIAAARSIFREKGYENTLVSDIAERADVVEGSVYRYFESKHDLLVKVIENWYQDMLLDYDQQLAGISGTRNRLRYMIWLHLRTINEEPKLSDLMLRILRSGSDYNTSNIYQLNRVYTRKTMDIIREGVDAGEFRNDISLRLVRDMIYGCIEHRTWSYMRGEGEFDMDSTADSIVNLLISGLEKAAPAVDYDQRIDLAVERLESLVAATKLD